jgi:hypothetical protein
LPINPQKSINQTLNTLETVDLHAARLSKPPEVTKTKTLTKDTNQKKNYKTTNQTKKTSKNNRFSYGN